MQCGSEAAAIWQVSHALKLLYHVRTVRFFSTRYEQPIRVGLAGSNAPAT
ncbi:hypothetical protein CPter291_3677 [Collimonas pratensis]|uniref:Uncharacterized protein n=1 Tax=Collimonas pratensis TaxID=279113 RepID=A0ABM5ZAA7_9BURK|nr:hypothetical protein CPter291_3677 [Collimonas pratensis]